MKILVKENQYNLLMEQVGLDDFMSKVSEVYPDSVYAMEKISDFIKKSNCQRIEFRDFNYPAAGVSLHDRVLINNNVLRSDFSFFLFVLFHEIAHQYQFKKYGIDVMYKIYTGEISLDKAAKFVKDVEDVADEFGIRKVRQIQSLYGDKIKLNSSSLVKPYKNMPLSTLKNMISHIINLLKQNNYKDITDISEIMYNHIKK
jgi:hypothetical protein